MPEAPFCAVCRRCMMGSAKRGQRQYLADEPNGFEECDDCATNILTLFVLYVLATQYIKKEVRGFFRSSGYLVFSRYMNGDVLS